MFKKSALLLAIASTVFMAGCPSTKIEQPPAPEVVDPTAPVTPTAFFTSVPDNGLGLTVVSDPLAITIPADVASVNIVSSAGSGFILGCTDRNVVNPENAENTATLTFIAGSSSGRLLNVCAVSDSSTSPNTSKTATFTLTYTMATQTNADGTMTPFAQRKPLGVGFTTVTASNPGALNKGRLLQYLAAVALRPSFNQIETGFYDVNATETCLNSANGGTISSTPTSAKPGETNFGSVVNWDMNNCQTKPFDINTSSLSQTVIATSTGVVYRNSANKNNSDFDQSYSSFSGKTSPFFEVRYSDNSGAVLGYKHGFGRDFTVLTNSSDDSAINRDFMKYTITSESNANYLERKKSQKVLITGNGDNGQQTYITNNSKLNRLATGTDVKVTFVDSYPDVCLPENSEFSISSNQNDNGAFEANVDFSTADFTETNIDLKDTNGDGLKDVNDFAADDFIRFATSNISPSSKAKFIFGNLIIKDKDNQVIGTVTYGKNSEGKTENKVFVTYTDNGRVVTTATDLGVIPLNTRLCDGNSVLPASPRFQNLYNLPVRYATDRIFNENILGETVYDVAGYVVPDFIATAVDLNVQFDASASINADGKLGVIKGNKIVSYAWDFGDGATQAASSSQTASHNYPSSAGSKDYNVTLTATDESGRSGSVIKKVTVMPPAPTTP